MPIHNPVDAGPQIAVHAAIDTGVHGVGVSTVCSETEADEKVAAIPTFTLKASDVQRNAWDPSRSTSSYPDWVKIKECRLDADLPACRIKFSLKSGNTDYNAHAQIYKNGDIIGAARSADTIQTFSQDFSGFVTNDLIQIYARISNNAVSSTVSNTDFFYSKFLTHITGKELATPLEEVTTDPTIPITVIT